jgi:aspartyl protease family protein
MPASRFLILLAVLAAGLAGSMPARAAMTELKAIQGGHFVATAYMNGTPVRIMVDTGATTVALSYEDAEAAGLRPALLDYNAPVATANGTIKAARVTIRRVEIDTVRVNDVPAMVMPQGAMRGSLLGMSFLSRLRSFQVEDGVLRLRD